MATRTNHINHIRDLVSTFFHNWADITEYLDQYTYEDLGNVLNSDDFVVGGANGDITTQQYIDGIAALQALKALIAANGTNLSRLRR